MREMPVRYGRTIQRVASMCVLTGSLLASFLVPGCSGSSTTTYPVRGLVRFPDGKLLREGTVEFETIGAGENITATGDIRPDGSFVLGTFSSNDGAVAGKHRAVVIADVEIGTGAERPGMLAPTRLDQKYRDFSTSGLQFDVQPGRNDIVIDVQYASALGTDE